MQERHRHGQNVLVDAEDRPMLIDFSDARLTSGCLDPITLELSPVFHPDANGARGDWPGAEQIGNWFDLDAYLVDCPIADYIRACRDWLWRVARSDGEVATVLAAYGIRQLKYKNTDHNLAKALIAAALDRLE